MSDDTLSKVINIFDRMYRDVDDERRISEALRRELNEQKDATEFLRTELDKARNEQNK